MSAAATALIGSASWERAPLRHLVLASSLPEDRNALGELGKTLAKGGAVALCVDKQHCAPGFGRRRLELAPLPLAPLVATAVRDKVAKAACSNKRRRSRIFFRGRHGEDRDVQEVRSRLWALRSLPNASIKFVKGGPQALYPSVDAFMRRSGVPRDNRVPLSAPAYADGALHADFCVVIRGDTGAAAHALVDAAAAGCVPLLIGDALHLPFSRLLPYANFSVHIDEVFSHPPISPMCRAPRFPHLTSYSLSRDRVLAISSRDGTPRARCGGAAAAHAPRGAPHRARGARPRIRINSAQLQRSARGRSSSRGHWTSRMCTESNVAQELRAKGRGDDAEMARWTRHRQGIRQRLCRALRCATRAKRLPSRRRDADGDPQSK